MNIKDFKSGIYREGYRYKYFLPEKINHDFIIADNKTQELLERASLKLGELNSYARFVPDIDMFITSYVMKEAVTSSRIEGTKTNIEEAFSDEADIRPEQKDDWNEVNQYVKAINFALNQLKKIPLSGRLLRDTHKILLSYVRGEHKQPGEFRASQNWIGGATISDATFIPPAHEYVKELMGDIEMFIHNENISVPHLIRAGIIHYQFETIHPFLDGNGRIGRMLITLYLVSRKILDKPLLYTSDFLERNKSVYIDKLNLARDNNDLLGWIRFFLVAIEQTAEKAANCLQEIIKLKNRLTEKVSTLGRKTNNAQKLLFSLFTYPVVSAKTVGDKLDVTPRASYAIVNDFIKLGILREITGYKRNRLFVFNDYIKILEK